ncbi:hypothetical protein PROFUN_05471 [Planoprotostelium fungivorum]|uniref:poly(ADP-ribose) glycohydrolase n=1 Tax=Planoprotostelium fungivorum TaxID=1890364 RepID=A0A2P6NQW6_9EUKA|nr:hypothetical protein PROFUN_05471 [Planoprotostelium fungivorum]
MGLTLTVTDGPRVRELHRVVQDIQIHQVLSSGNLMKVCGIRDIPQNRWLNEKGMSARVTKIVQSMCASHTDNQRSMDGFTLLPNHDEDSWYLVKGEIEKEWNELEDVVRCIVFFTSKDFDDVCALPQILLYNASDAIDTDFLLRKVVPIIKKLALELPTLFPDGKLRHLPAGSSARMSLTRRQVACLLSHMFLCTLTRPEWMHRDLYHDFRCWHFSELPSAHVYLETLLLYFKSFAEGMIDSDDTIEFSRKSLSTEETPTWNDVNLTDQIGVRVYGDIGDSPNEAEIDCANRSAGFGKTGSQEEILLGTSSEACVLIWIFSSMEDQEAVSVKGAARISRCRGYGIDLQLLGREDQEGITKSQNRVIIAMDALECDHFGSKYESMKFQLEPANVSREMRKAYVAFSLASELGLSVGVSALWGCGHYAGNPRLKFLLLWIAASAANIRLDLCTYGDETYGEEIERVVKKYSGQKAAKLIEKVENLRGKLTLETMRFTPTSCSSHPLSLGVDVTNEKSVSSLDPVALSSSARVYPSITLTTFLQGNFGGAHTQIEEVESSVVSRSQLKSSCDTPM